MEPIFQTTATQDEKKIKEEKKQKEKKRIRSPEYMKLQNSKVSKDGNIYTKTVLVKLQ